LTDDSPFVSPQVVYIPPPLIHSVIDVAPLQSAHIESPGFYYAVGRTDTRLEYRGFSVFISQDEGVSYERFVDSNKESDIGSTDTILADGTIDGWDLVNTVDVTMFGGTLSSVAQESVLFEQNIALIGTEVIGFADVEVIGEGQYRLSTLLRGLRNTDQVTGDHIVVEQFVPLSVENVSFAEVSPNLIGSALKFKIVPEGAAVEDANEVDVVLIDGTRRCFAPVDVQKELDGFNNADFTWERRTRDLIDDYGDIPLLESPERYEIDFFDGVTIVRTQGVEGAQTMEYTSSNQSADGLTPGNPIKLELFQLNKEGVRGLARAVTI